MSAESQNIIITIANLILAAGAILSLVLNVLQNQKDVKREEKSKALCVDVIPIKLTNSPNESRYITGFNYLHIYNRSGHAIRNFRLELNWGMEGFSQSIYVPKSNEGEWVIPPGEWITGERTNERGKTYWFFPERIDDKLQTELIPKQADKDNFVNAVKCVQFTDIYGIDWKITYENSTNKRRIERLK